MESKANMVTNIPSLRGTVSLDQNTHLYLTVPDMPRAVTQVRSMGDVAPSPKEAIASALPWQLHGFHCLRHGLRNLS